MLRSGASALARRAVIRSSSKGIPATFIPRASFHLSAPRKEEAKVEEAVEAPPFSKGGLLGTGYSEWFALPIGMAAAVPLIHFDWYVINEETQLAAVFVAFCVTLYTQGGEAIHKALTEEAETLLAEYNEVEDQEIQLLEDRVELLKGNLDRVDQFEAIHQLRLESYDKLNAAGKIKPQYDFKAQVERVVDIIAQEEASVMEKTKVALMAEATASVSQEFVSSKALKKAALDAAIATIKGDAKAPADPVQGAFVKFFKQKSAALKKSDDGSEAAAQRAALVAKLNVVVKNEGFLFSFDEAGKPKMNV